MYKGRENNKVLKKGKMTKRDGEKKKEKRCTTLLQHFVSYNSDRDPSSRPLFLKIK